MIKRLAIVLLTLLSTLLSTACGKSTANYSSDYFPGYDYYAEYFADAGIPNPYIVVDELISQGYSDDVDELRNMVDKIGCYPSVLFGTFIADKDRVVHMTDGPCFETIDSENLVPIGPFASLSSVEKEISDGDTYLDGYSICEKCCKG